MKIIRILHNNESRYGIIDGENINLIDGDVFGEFILSNETVLLKDANILPPTNPSKIVCVGLNFMEHQKEMNDYADAFPKIFIKPSTTVIAHDEDIIYPDCVNRVDYEAELAVVIKKTAKNIKKSTYKDYILGYTCLNDVTAREIQKLDGQWTRSKSYDTFAPYGPYIVTDLDTSNLSVKSILNGDIKQNDTTANFIWDVDFLVTEISKVMTLLPGDVISTGTPSGCGEMNVGDKIEIEVEGVGKLINYVREVK